MEWNISEQVNTIQTVGNKGGQLKYNQIGQNGTHRTIQNKKKTNESKSEHHREVRTRWPHQNKA